MRSLKLRSTPDHWLALGCATAVFFCGGCAAHRDQSNLAAAPGASETPEYLSPSALIVSPDGQTLYVACATTTEVLVFNLEKMAITRRVALPAPPSGLALSREDNRLYVTCSGPESSVCIVGLPAGKVTCTIAAGHTAMSPVLSPDEKTLFVCNRFNDAVSVISLEKQKEVARIPVQREPVASALSLDGQRLFVANHLHKGRADVGVVASSVSVIDTAAQRVIQEIALPNGSTLLRGMCVSPDGKYVAVTHGLARFHLPTTHVTWGWMNDNALSLIDVEELKLLNTVLLDDLVEGAANPWGVAWSNDGNYICVTHAGTHELSVIRAPALLAKLKRLPLLDVEPTGKFSYFAPARVPADVPNDLRFLVGLRNRVKLPGFGPRALAISANRAYVACYFSDSIQTVDLTHRERPAVSSVALAPPIQASAARQGELYFNDATLCEQGWQSCASCHSSDARVDGLDWDLANDGIGNPKNVKSLLLSFQTPPVMSMGVRADAATAIRAGIRYILFTNAPPEFAAAIDEYVKSLKPMPSPRLAKGRLTSSAERGKKLFFDSSIGCARCHPPPLFTDLKPHAVGAGKFDTESDRFYTPTLIEVWRTGPYLHDGSARTILEAITTHNPHDARGRTSRLGRAELEDLASYVESL